MKRGDCMTDNIILLIILILIVYTIILGFFIAFCYGKFIKPKITSSVEKLTKKSMGKEISTLKNEIEKNIKKLDENTNKKMNDITKRVNRISDEDINYIRKLRRRGYTQNETAEKAEVSQSTVSKYDNENNKSGITESEVFVKVTKNTDKPK